jgi:ATP-dependent DNA ligase
MKTAYLDGELCDVDDAGLPSFARTQAAGDGERGVHVVYYAFDILHIAGRDVSNLPLVERKALLEPLVGGKLGLQFNGHDAGDGELILKHAGKLGFEGVVSKTINAPYAPGNRGLWRKAKALNRQEFVVVGWSDPEGSRPHLGALLLGSTATAAGSFMPAVSARECRLSARGSAAPLGPPRPQDVTFIVPPPRARRFGSPLVLSRVHWVEPKLVAEISYLTWTAENLLRHKVYVGLREDKPAEQVRRELAQPR